MCDRVNFDYFDKVLERVKVDSCVLEVGSYDVNGNCKSCVLEKGMEYLGVDIRHGPGVDVVCDMGLGEEVSRCFGNKKFDLIVCMNVLEHVFEPIRLLDNLVSLLADDGYLVIVVPSVWDLHDYPADYYRLNPDFFSKYGALSQLDIVGDLFSFSVRNTRKFYQDVSVLPMVMPDIYRNRFVLFCVKVFSLFWPEIRQVWPYTYLNVTYRSNRKG